MRCSECEVITWQSFAQFILMHLHQLSNLFSLFIDDIRANLACELWNEVEKKYHKYMDV